MAGYDPRSPIALGGDPGRFAEPLDGDVRGLRLGWWGDLGGIPIDGEVSRVVNAQRGVFDTLGCVVETAEPDFSGADEAFKTLRALAFVTNLGELVREHRDEFKETILWEVDRGLRLGAGEIARAERARTEIFHRTRAFFERYDCFVLPTTQVSPFDVSEEFVGSIDGVAMTTYIDWMKSCYYISITGCPAISVPCGFTAGALPVGMQIVGRPRDERRLLRIAYAFEQAARVERRWPFC
jgi:amidase